MEVIAEIRRRHLVSKESISSIARDLKLSRQTVRKHLQTEAEPVYSRNPHPSWVNSRPPLKAGYKPNVISPRRSGALRGVCSKACRPRAIAAPTTACSVA
jgi:predicted transcriptional regulator